MSASIARHRHRCYTINTSVDSESGLNTMSSEAAAAVTVPSAEDLPIATRLSAALADAAGGPLVELSHVVGGHSGITYLARFPAVNYVVKAVPPGQRAVGRNDVLRQAAALRALHDVGQPVPHVAASGEEEPAWFAMAFAAGDAVEPVMDDDVLDPDVVRDRWRVAAAALKSLHHVPVASPTFAAESVSTPDAELKMWAKVMAAVPSELKPGGDRAFELLATSVPEPVPASVTHGDFRLGNLLFEDRELHAIVDWEIWGVGDPRVDLGWFLTFADNSCFPSVGHEVEDLPSVEEIVGAYAGDEERPVDLGWFLALGRLKLAAIMGHNLKRHRQGKHVDPYLEQLPGTIEALIESAHSLLASLSSGRNGVSPRAGVRS